MKKFIPEWQPPLEFASGLPENMPMKLGTPNRAKPSNRRRYRSQDNPKRVANYKKIENRMLCGDD